MTEADEQYPHFVFAKIWDPIHPIERGERYEDPLQSLLEKQGLGEVTGGGSSIDQEYGIQYIGVDIDLANLDALDLVKAVLEEAGAPKGSELEYEVDGQLTSVRFGTTERVTVWLDGVTLPDEVYEQSSSDELGDQIVDAMSFDARSEIRGSWQGPRETSIYIHGTDAERLYRAIEPVLRARPDCQNARVIVRDGNPALEPREVRMPMHGRGGPTRA